MVSVLRLDLVYYVVKCTQAMIGVCGNWLIIVAILRFDFLKSATDVFIFNLAINDFQTGLLTPLSIVVNYMQPEVTFAPHCSDNLLSKIQEFGQSYENKGNVTTQEPNANTTLSTSCTTNDGGKLAVNETYFEMWSKLCLAKEITGSLQSSGSIIGIFLISIDRFVFIEKPLRYYAVMSVRRAIGACVFMWILNIVVGPVLLPFHLHLVPEQPCDTSIWSSVYFYGIATPLFTILTFTNIVVYTRIAFVAFKRGSVAPAVTAAQNAEYNKKVRKDNKITKMLCIVLGLYFVLYLPSILFGSFDSRGSPAPLIVVKYVSFLLWYFSMCVNPLIYAWKSKEFRKAFCLLLRLRNRTENDDSTTEPSRE